jgi:hypothetical protein
LVKIHIFWDKDHHYWLVSQFGDIIDLTISQLHLHPQKKREDQIPLLPIWWSPLDQLPPLFRYLQNTYGNPKIDLSESENQIFINYTKYLQDKIESGTIDTDAFQHFNILTGEEKLSKLYENKNPWPFVILDNHDKMDWPKWIKNKETNLLKKHYENHPNDNLG